jgi:hypothetical protein
VEAAGTSTNTKSPQGAHQTRTTMSASGLDETRSVDTSAHARVRPPTTTNDDGNPTESISIDTERIFRLIEDERHLVAQNLYYSVQDRLQQSAAPSPTDKGPGKPAKLHLRPLQNRRQLQEIKKLKASERKEHEKARGVLEANQAILEKLEVRMCFLLTTR